MSKFQKIDGLTGKTIKGAFRSDDGRFIIEFLGGDKLTFGVTNNYLNVDSLSAPVEFYVEGKALEISETAKEVLRNSMFELSKNTDGPIIPE